MMRVLLLTAALLSCPGVTYGQNCADTTTWSATRLLGRAKTLVSDTTESFRIYRDSVMKVTATSEANVVFVAADSICQLAKAAYEAEITTDPPHTVKVHVFQIGTDYLVVDPEQTHGAHKLGVVFNSSFVKKSTANIDM